MITYCKQKQTVILKIQRKPVPRNRGVAIMDLLLKILVARLSLQDFLYVCPFQVMTQRTKVIGYIGQTGN